MDYAVSARVYISQVGDYLNENQTIILRLLFWLWCTYEAVLGFIVNFFFSDRGTYNNFCVSDWMINYQGGFVRRGIVGEALYQLYIIHPYPLRTVVFVIITITFFGLLYLLYRLFKQNGWSYILFPSCVLGVQGFTCEFLWTRKDYILLLGAFLLFMYYCKWICRKERLKSYVVMQAVAMLLMLIHEATFFFTIPILACDYLCRVYGTGKHGLFVSAAKSLLLFSPVIATWVAVCLCKGNNDTAAFIWDSWRPMMAAYPHEGSTCEIGKSIAWLGKNFTEAASIHISLNFRGWFFYYIPSLPLTLYCYVAVYYVVTRMQTMDLKFNRLKPVNSICLSNIMFVQFIFLLPMFTVLSCDGMRTIPYWIISSLFFYHFFSKSSSVFPEPLTKVSTKIQMWIASKPKLNNPWIYFIIIATIPLKNVGNSCYDAIFHWWLFKDIIKFIADSCFGG